MTATWELLQEELDDDVKSDLEQKCSRLQRES